LFLFLERECFYLPDRKKFFIIYIMKRILLIEDEALLGKMYLEEMKKNGFEILWARDGEKGLKMAKKDRPDLVLLDIVLPQKTGTEVLRELKKDNSTSSIPVIIFTNFEDKECRELAQKFQIEYLLKTDYTPSMLIEKIKKALWKE